MRALSVVVGSAVLMLDVAHGALRHESFDREPPNWEGVNNRSTAFEPKNALFVPATFPLIASWPMTLTPQLYFGVCPAGTSP